MDSSKEVIRFKEPRVNLSLHPRLSVRRVERGAQPVGQTDLRNTCKSVRRNGQGAQKLVARRIIRADCQSTQLGATPLGRLKQGHDETQQMLIAWDIASMFPYLLKLCGASLECNDLSEDSGGRPWEGGRCLHLCLSTVLGRTQPVRWPSMNASDIHA